MSYHIQFNNEVLGPMTEHQLMAYPIDENTFVSVDGGPWQRLYTIPELMAKLSERRNATHRHNSDDSKKILCGIMAIIFGTLGVQYFIVGKVGAGLLTILLSLVTCGGWGIITLIQGILMLTMSDAEFNRKYVLSTSFFPLF